MGYGYGEEKSKSRIGGAGLFGFWAGVEAADGEEEENGKEAARSRARHVRVK